MDYGYGYPNQYDNSNSNYNQYSQSNYGEGTDSQYYQDIYRTRNNSSLYPKQWSRSRSVDETQHKKTLMQTCSMFSLMKILLIIIILLISYYYSYLYLKHVIFFVINPVGKVIIQILLIFLFYFILNPISLEVLENTDTVVKEIEKDEQSIQDVHNIKDKSINREETSPEVVEDDLSVIYPSMEEVDNQSEVSIDQPSGKSNKTLHYTTSNITTSKCISSSNHSRLADFLLDSGCGAHVVNDISLLDNVVYRRSNQILGRVTGSIANVSIKIEAVGTIPTLGKVLYAPFLTHNLISVGALTNDNFSVKFENNTCSASNNTEFFNGNIYCKRNSSNRYPCNIQVRNIDAPQSITTYSSKSMRREETIHLECLMTTVAESNIDDILTDPVSLKNDLILDSGCSEHMFNSARQLTDYNRYNVDEKYVFVANGSKVPVLGIGKCGILRQVYYVPRLSHSLLSVSSLTREGMRVLFKDDYAIISKGDSNLEFDTLRAKKINKLYKIS